MTPDLTRRLFLSSSAALLASPALSQTKPNLKTYVVPPEHQPVIVRLRDTFEPGILLVDPNTFSLYWLIEPRRAVRFVVGVGRGNLYEPGSFTVGAKKEWPSWTPTKEMIARNPGAYAKYADGMPGGPGNPLGARALYLFDERRGDTFLRIHGTPEPWTIASAVSNGCVRLPNEHIQQLYDMVPIGAKVVLYPKRAAA
ncbi:MAG: L,D-transpeptidase [Pseudotabrizicola sp.]|uniref:L,D-transpeptidase n=1 Tax=Pseudotabrizicola sp. TaxID=2939647 RepID=UPI002723A64E|nr:L,D-transpeptidase [Pseudotabrizicola sp.]MDO8881883.1 L,D-transpeptidase [Pseudotabrizicola sp.]MDP2082046.1 L,D-transpeptidase [Pseudotabrizicola sp.]MDZ7576439.1 L,D-transpeptidase [Pseudotabrizicola sp.]